MMGMPSDPESAEERRLLLWWLVSCVQLLPALCEVVHVGGFVIERAVVSLRWCVVGADRYISLGAWLDRGYSSAQFLIPGGGMLTWLQGSSAQFVRCRRRL